MTPESKSLEDLKTALTDKAPETPAPQPEVKSERPETPTIPQIDDLGRSYATGKRKNSIARVWIKPGKGQITVNGKNVSVYFARQVLQMLINHPYKIAGRENHYDTTCTVKGGGLSGQAGAIKHGISKALTYQEPELRGILKKEGLLTRDSRIVERKKYGQRKARRRFQFSKR